MAENNIYTKGTINSIYNKLNDTSRARCNTRFPDDTQGRKVCYHQAMADNARILITRLRGQLGGCTRTNNPEKCVATINKLIMYLETKQEQHEQHVDQLKELEG